MKQEGLQVSIRAEGDELFASLSGEIEHHSTAPVRTRIDTALFKHRPRRLCLDLAGVRFMDSSGLGLVLGRAALCEEMGTELCLLHPTSRVEKIFAIAGLSRLKNIKIEK